MNFLAAAAGLLSGIIGAMGMGGGAVLIIYLTVFADTPQLKAQGINLIFFIPIAVTAVIVYAIKKQIKWKTVLPVCLGGLLGASAGIFIGSAVGGTLLGKAFGGCLIVLGLFEIFKRKKST